MVAGAVLGGIAIGLIGLVTERWQLLALYAMFGVGNTAVSLLPATTLVTRWFDARRRAVALSITSTGLSLGGVLLTPLSVVLLESMGLTPAMLTLGIVYCVTIVPLALFTVRSFPPGYTRPQAGATHMSGATIEEARRSRFFIVLTGSYVLLMGTQVAGIAHLYNRGVEIVGPIEASIAVSVLASMSILARLAGGWLLAHLPMMRFTFANMAGQAVGLAILADPGSAAMLWFGAGIFGCTVGNLLMLQPLLLAHAFGPRDYPRVFALSQGVSTLGIAAGPVLMGMLYGVGGYALAFSAGGVTSGVALAVLLTAGRMPEGERA